MTSESQNPYHLLSEQAAEALRPAEAAEDRPGVPERDLQAMLLALNRTAEQCAHTLSRLTAAAEQHAQACSRLAGTLECLTATIRLPIRALRKLLHLPGRLSRALKERSAKRRIVGTATNQSYLPPDDQRDLLIITPDILGRVRIGLGMRHWEIAKALASRGALVTLATRHPLPDDLRPEGFALHKLATDQEAVGLARRHRCVMLQGEATEFYPTFRTGERPIIVDLAAPLHLENLERNQPDFDYSKSVIVHGLERGDFFVCGNERQRLYWLGMLTALGRIGKDRRDASPELRNLIDVVGFGISEEPPIRRRAVLKGVIEGIGPDDFVMTWFGGIWDWLDPLPLIRATGEAWKQDPRLKLFFLASRIPNGAIPGMANRARELARELGLLSRCVFFNEHPVPYDDRADYLLDTDIGILCQTRNLETQVAARIRLLEYLWGERPILMNEGDEWADTVRKHDLGLVVEGKEVEDWKQSMLRLCRDSLLRARMKANLARMKPQFYWRQCIEPLYQYVMQKRGYAVPDRPLAKRAG